MKVRRNPSEKGGECKVHVRRHEGPDQARMGHQRHVVQFHVVGQWRVSDENVQEKLEMIHGHDSI
jgi:hypothetical protein